MHRTMLVTLACAGGLLGAPGAVAHGMPPDHAGAAPMASVGSPLASTHGHAADLDWGSFVDRVALGPVTEQRRARGVVVRPRAVPRRPVVRTRPVVVRRGFYAPYPYYGFRYGGYWGRPSFWGYPWGYAGVYGVRYGYGYPYGYGYGSPYGYGHGYPYGYAGAIRLKIKPNQAEVFVDGYYVGRVDEFDGVFQALRLEPGPKRIDVRAPGFDTLTLEVRILPGETIKYEGNLRAGPPGPAPQPTAPPPPSGLRPLPERPPDWPAVEPRGPRRGQDPDTEPVAFGGIRLNVEPREAQVFVEGYYVGTVEDFDDSRGLPLESGPRTIEMRAEGYAPLIIDVRILPDETITYEGELTPLATPPR